MTPEQECEKVRGLFFDAFLHGLETDPEWYSDYYKAPIEEIRADPKKFYNLRLDAAVGKLPNWSNSKPQKPIVEAEGLL